jgi:LmbE family N-acetylglucosaminyl deacetylase
VTVLVVAAHPDDELLGCGGTLARHVLRGEEVHALVLADGATSRYDDRMTDTLAASARDAAKHLGLSSIEFGWFPDQRLDAVALLDLTQHVEGVVDRLRPSVVYTHFPGDANADHGLTARAAWTACRPYVLPRLRRFAVYETPSSTEWGWPLGSPVFQPTRFVDVSETLPQKLAAMACYGSELRPYPHPRSLRALEERAAYWGSQVGLSAAEPFQVLREIS